MTPFTKYEVQIYTRGAWKIESIYDDREIAIFEAKKIQRGGHYLAVRVIEERASPLRGEADVKIVFRATKANEGGDRGPYAHKAARQEAQLALRAMRADGGDSEMYSDYGEVAVESCAGAVLMVLGLGGILLIGIAAIFAIRHYFGAL
jgi:hypothetical protein